MGLTLAVAFSLRLVLLVAALLCFFLAAIGQPQSGRVNLVALGLFFWVLAVLFA
jgi:hypothetical protein